MNILYFPDLPELEEYRDYEEALKKIFYEEGGSGEHVYIKQTVHTEEYNFDEHPMESLAQKVIWRGRRPDIVVGNGFGALYALILTQLNNCSLPIILINPMYPSEYYLEENLPDYKYANFLEKYTFDTLCDDIKDEPEKFKNIYVILGKDDDITDTKRTKDYFLGSNVLYARGGHFLTEETLAQSISEILGVINDEEKLKTEKEKTKARNVKKAFDELKEFAVGGGKKDLLYIKKCRENQGEEGKLLRKVLADLKGDPRYKGLNTKYISVDELPAPNESLRSRFKDLNVLVIDNIKKKFITKEIEDSIFIACDEAILNGGKVVILADEWPKKVFSRNADIMHMIYDGKIKEYYGWDVNGSGITVSRSSLHTYTRKGYQGEKSMPYADRYVDVKVSDVDMSNGSFTVLYTTPYIDEGILYLYYKDGKWHAEDEESKKPFPQEVSAVLKAASGKIARIIEQSMDKKYKDYQDAADDDEGEDDE